MRIEKGKIDHRIAPRKRIDYIHSALVEVNQRRTMLSAVELREFTVIKTMTPGVPKFFAFDVHSQIVYVTPPPYKRMRLEIIGGRIITV